jgi:CheY-like chemotaxis protein
MTKKTANVPLSVLVVDDEPDVRASLCDCLASSGHNYLEAASGNSAIEILMTQRVDVVLSDWRMPNGTGLELLSWIKSVDPQHPPVLLMTGVADVSTPEALDLGVEDILMKPFSCEAVLAAVDKARRRPQDRWTEAAALQVDDLVPHHIELQMESLDVALKSGVIELGQGGMFLSLGSAFPLSFERVRFSISFAAAPIRRLAGDGLVRWARPHAAHGFKNGIGIEFRFVEPEAQVELRRLIEGRRIVSFIPVGRTD